MVTCFIIDNDNLVGLILNIYIRVFKCSLVCICMHIWYKYIGWAGNKSV